MIKLRGVYAIPPTPFTAEGELDEQGLQSTVRFCLRAGVHGIVTPVNASEFTSLTDEERIRVVRIVVEETAGKVPVVAGVTGVSLEHATYHARLAREIGADSLIAMPPCIKKATTAEIRRYYAALDREAHGLPVWIQNHLGPVGTPMSPEFMVEIIKGCETVNCVKEESWPSGHFISKTIGLAGDRLRSIHGGMAGRYLMEEHARGSHGTMPACEIADLHVALWNKLEGGDITGARSLFNTILPLLNVEFMYGVSVYKEVLMRRGVISSAFIREAGHFELDEHNHRELDAILSSLEPLFTA